MCNLHQVQSAVNFLTVFAAAVALVCVIYIPMIVHTFGEETGRRRWIICVVFTFVFIGGAAVAATLLHWMFNYRKIYHLAPGGIYPAADFIVFFYYGLAAIAVLFQAVRYSFAWLGGSRVESHKLFKRWFPWAGALILSGVSVLLLAYWQPPAPQFGWTACWHGWLGAPALLIGFAPSLWFAFDRNFGGGPANLIPFYTFCRHWRNDFSMISDGFVEGIPLFVCACLQVAGLYALPAVLAAFGNLFVAIALLIQHGMAVVILCAHAISQFAAAAGLLGMLLLLLAPCASAALGWLTGRMSISYESSIHREGRAIDRSHVWRLQGTHTGGSAASVSDVYDKYHGAGSWYASIRRRSFFFRVFFVAVSAGLPVFAAKNFLVPSLTDLYFYVIAALTTLCASVAMVWTVRRWGR